MTLRTHIDKAGKYPVVQKPCPHFGPVVLSAPRTGILHTTECSWRSAAQEFAVKYAPHFELGLDEDGKVEIAQLVPIGFMGAALRTHNDHAIVQIEMVGKSLETPWLPDPDTLDALKSLMEVCRDEWGIPLSHPWKDGDYGRYGDNPHRHSGNYGKVAGWYGHADVPFPDEHWDPGNLCWSKVFAHVVTPDASVKKAA